MRKLFCIVAILIGIFISSCQSEEEIPTGTEIIMITDEGKLFIQLFDETPVHKKNFIKLAREGFFDGMAFHRVIEEFVVQAGDPRTIESFPPKGAKDKQDAGYSLPAEIIDTMAHIEGALGAARENDDINPKRVSSSSQFYFVTGEMYTTQEIDSVQDDRTGELLDNLYTDYEFATDSLAYTGSFQDFQDSVGFQAFQYSPTQRVAYQERGGAINLDNRYTIFGRILKGIDVIREIETVTTNVNDIPIKPIRIKKVRVLIQT